MITIVVPIYNVSKTLRRCVDSIASQSWKDWEMILVDDGSTDGSGDIAEQLAATDERISVVHQRNGGLSATRNTGIRNAKGDYITFIDSDDTIAPDTLSDVMKSVGEHPEWDVTEYPMHVNIGHPTAYVFNPGNTEYREPQDYLTRGNALEHTWACNKVYKRTVFEKIMFPEGRYYEDLWMMGDMLCIDGIVIGATDKGCYEYYWNSEGISKKGSKKKLEHYIETLLRNRDRFGIDTREPRWHRYYMQMLNAQIMYSQQGGGILIPSQRVRIRNYYGMSSVLKAILIDTIGLRRTVKVFTR